MSESAGTSGIQPTFTGADAHRWLREELPYAAQVRIAVAYIDRPGIEQLHAALGSHRLDAGEVRCQLLWGEPVDRREDLEALSLLHELRKQYPSVFDARRMSSQRGAAFHPKMYLVTRQGGDLRLLLGSSNLTNAGLGENTEGNLRCAVGAQWVEQVRDQFDEWWYASADLPGKLGDPEPPLPPPTPPIARPITQRLADALASGFIAEFTVQPGAIWLGLRPELLKLPQSTDLDGKHLNVRTRSELRLRLVSEETVRAIDSLRARVQGSLRTLSLNTAWGRFVPHDRLSALQAERPAIEKRIDETLATIKEAETRHAADVDEALRTEFLALWQQLHGGDSTPEASTVADVVALARAARARTDVLDRLRSELRLRLSSVPLPAVGGACPTELREQCEADWKEDLRRFAITATSAPRRSLLKYRNPDIALALCPLDDPWMVSACRHRWRPARGTTTDATGQPNLFDGKTLSDVESALRRQVTEVQAWHALSFEEVMNRYERLITPPT